jgi:outer membrane lipoprotein LolB
MRLLWVSSLLLLHACATLQPPAGQELEFALQGRFSAQHGEDSVSGLLSWQASDGRDELLLSSPLGQGLANISRDAQGVSLTRPGEPVMRAENAEVLTESALGFGLPLGGLRFWVQGKPDPARPHNIKLTLDGLTEQIIQDGWTIDYPQYREARPRKIHVRREGLQLRLVIDEWQP